MVGVRNGLRLDQDCFVSSEQAVKGSFTRGPRGTVASGLEAIQNLAWLFVEKVTKDCPAFLKGMEALISSVKER